jgi:hypothetical protein
MWRQETRARPRTGHRADRRGTLPRPRPQSPRCEPRAGVPDVGQSGFPAERCAHHEPVSGLGGQAVLVTEFVVPAAPLKPGRSAALRGERSPGGGAPSGTTVGREHGATSGQARAAKRPRHHQRELFSPQRVAVRPDPLGHDNVRTRVAQRDGPAGRVLEKERLQRASDEVRTRKRIRHHGRRSVTSARRRAEDRTVDVGMAKPDGERELSTCGNTKYRRALGGQRDSETRPRPLADVLDEELLVRREPLRVKDRRVLVEPQHLVVGPVSTDNHRRRGVGGLKDAAPPRDQLAVTCEHDCLGRNWRYVHRHLPTTVVVKPLGDELSRGGR